MAVALADLPDWHVRVLRWFSDHAGEFFEKRPVGLGTMVEGSSLSEQYLTAPQGPGIWKPSKALSEYAVSVYQSWKSRYPDQPPITWGDGQWTYIYHQEGPAEEDPYKRGTNRGLMACWADGIPVGVLIPEKLGRVKGYRVLGLAVIDDRVNGCFVLTGPVSLRTAAVHGMPERPLVSVVSLSSGVFDPEASMDAREKTVAEVVRRQGQPGFRRTLLGAYEERCCVTDFDAAPALEAAHIIPYRGAHSNHPENGLLLRADVHDLFDLGLIGVRPSDMRVVCSDELAQTRYARLDGRPIRLPEDPLLRPNERALEKHLEIAGLGQ